MQPGSRSRRGDWAARNLGALRSPPNPPLQLAGAPGALLRCAAALWRRAVDHRIRNPETDRPQLKRGSLGAFRSIGGTLRFASVFQAFVAVILAVPAVANAQGSAANQVVGVAGDDSAMNAAIAKAHATIGDFVRRLDRPPLSPTDVSLKVRLTDGREVEHVWLADVHHNGTRFWGRIS
jgi:hypothetical protein